MADEFKQHRIEDDPQGQRLVADILKVVAGHECLQGFEVLCFCLKHIIDTNADDAEQRASGYRLAIGMLQRYQRLGQH